MDARTDTGRSSTRDDALARAREFFGGIWFKVFSERGPSRTSRPL